MGVGRTPSSSLSVARAVVDDRRSMSQGFPHQAGGFSFTDGGGGFGRRSSTTAAAAGSHDAGGAADHVAQQRRRDKLRVQEFDPGDHGGGVHALLDDEEDAAEPSGMYEHTAGGSNMLSEMFNIPSVAVAAPPSATELLASQMSAGYRLGLRSAPPPHLAGDGWYGGGRHGSSLSSFGETSSSPALGADSAAAMHLFLQQPNRPSATPPPHDPQSFQAFSGAVPFAGGVVESQAALSLSLSSSLQQLEMAKAEELRLRDNVLYFNSQQPPPPSPPLPLHSVAAGPPPQLHVAGGAYGTAGGVANVLRTSKYARPAQELLEEFCSVGRGSHLRAASTSKPKPAATGASTSTSAGGAASSSSAPAKDPPALSPADRFEHQRKKAKLISMLDEVERRYNHYCSQMQMVVNFFDAVMGFGAAAPYTALAQKAMSRHFRCLKDAIAAQLRQSCEALGEKDAGAASGLTKGETPRLRLLDQSMRHQRAFHHMGLMEQEAWRPQRGLPERSVNILRSWLFEHFLHPYPSDADKHLLARQTGLSRNQVSNWFINARVRLWKPMIEEMYQQESKELEGSSSEPPDHAAAGQLLQHQQQQQCMLQGMQPHKVEAGGAGPSTSSSAMLLPPPHVDDAAVLMGLDPAELLGPDPHAGGDVGDVYRYSQQLHAAAAGRSIQFGAGGSVAPSGDVSLTLGLQHAGAATGDGRARPPAAYFLRDHYSNI